MLILAEAVPPPHHYTLWENVGYTLLLLGVACLYLCYRFGFKTKAKCMVIRDKPREPCREDASVLLGCEEHRLGKPVAWFRHLGAARWLDPWLNFFHIVPASFAPMPMPVIRTKSSGNLSTASAPTAVPGNSGTMTRELRVALWSLACGVVQAGTGIVALAIAA